MIVVKPIGSVRIGNLSARLTIGKKVPEAVLWFWKKTNQIDELIKIGAIEPDKKNINSANNDNVRQTENRQQKNIR